MVPYHDSDLSFTDGQVSVVVDEKSFQREVTFLRDAVFRRRLTADEKDDAETAFSNDFFGRDDVPTDRPGTP
jgi:hypothetical protein